MNATPEREWIGIEHVFWSPQGNVTAPLVLIESRLISDPDGANHGLQFSFATKLAHMIDPRIPAYDSFVAGFYFYIPPASDRPFEERLMSLLGLHSFLEREYARVLQDDLLRPAIEQFRGCSGIGEVVPDERIVDWLLWAWVWLLREGAQFRGQAMYE